MKNLAIVACCVTLLVVVAHAEEFKTNKLESISGEVRVEQNVQFLEKDRNEKADLYFPVGVPANKRLPAMVIIHGGGWYGGVRNGNREINIGTTLARNGYVGFSIDYLLSDKKHAVWPTNLYDCKNAVRWLRKNADRLQIDPDRIGVIGGSAGGHLAAMVALTGPDDGLEPAEPFPGISDQVRCCVDMYGISDVAAYKTNEGMLGKTFAVAPDLYRQASPINYVRSNSPPILILHGTADKLVSTNQSKLFADSLAKGGAPHQLVWVEGASHSFTLEPKQRDLRPLVMSFLNRELSATPPASDTATTK